MVAAFDFFGAVPKEVWWDNPRTVATLILLGRERQLHPRYAAFARHYVFEPRFCMPARGNEKPDAEGTVKAVQRRFATPVPRVADLDELNMFLRTRCEAERERVVQSLFGPFTIKDHLAEDLAAASPLPKHRFDPCVIKPAVAVDKYQSVAFDGNRYSVPRAFAFQMVSVKGYVDHVAIVAHGQVVATHVRSFEKKTMILDPLHYLATLSRKPGALDHAPVFRDWKLPACFPRSSYRAGTTPWRDGRCEAIRSRLATAGRASDVACEPSIEACQHEHLYSAEAVIQRTQSLAAIEATNQNAAATRESEPFPRVEVPLPDLSHFDQLLTRPTDEGPVSVFFA